MPTTLADHLAPLQALPAGQGLKTSYPFLQVGYRRRADAAYDVWFFGAHQPRLPLRVLVRPEELARVAQLARRLGTTETVGPALEQELFTFSMDHGLDECLW